MYIINEPSVKELPKPQSLDQSLKKIIKWVKKEKLVYKPGIGINPDKQYLNW